MKDNILNIYGPTYKISKDFLEKAARASLNEIGIKEKVLIDFSFVSESEIKKLNKKFRGKDKVTDVLSFSFLDKEGLPDLKEEILGQIVICYKVAEKQARLDEVESKRAKKNKNSFDKETALLLIHGILHLFGYRHNDYNQKKKMQIKENLILKKLNLI